MNWTQPLCETCWTGVEPNRDPITLKEEFRDTEKCALCGTMTSSGIYRRMHPSECLFPAKD